MISLKYLVIPLSLLIGLTLLILPLPEWARIYRPDWVALFLIYWSTALPKRVGLWTAFITGLFVEVSQGTLISLTPSRNAAIGAKANTMMISFTDTCTSV